MLLSRSLRNRALHPELLSSVGIGDGVNEDRVNPLFLLTFKGKQE